MLLGWVTSLCTSPSGYLHLSKWLSVTWPNFWFWGTALVRVPWSGTQPSDHPHCLWKKPYFFTYSNFTVVIFPDRIPQQEYAIASVKSKDNCHRPHHNPFLFIVPGDMEGSNGRHPDHQSPNSNRWYQSLCGAPVCQGMELTDWEH